MDAETITITQEELAEALESALKVHDEAQRMNREYGFDLFDRDAAPGAMAAAIFEMVKNKE